MIADRISFKGHRCFKNEWAGFDVIKPVNVIIGRNNTGKSHLLDLVEALCERKLKGRGWQLLLHGVLDHGSLRQAFPENRNGGPLGGYHWNDHGQYFVDVPITWESNGAETGPLVFPDGFNYTSRQGTQSTQARLATIKQVTENFDHALMGTIFRRLLADRDVDPEQGGTDMLLGPDGHGATNIVRRYIYTSDPQFPREVIQRELLEALNTVFGKDGQFTEIHVRHHDHPDSGSAQNHWEIYLGEEKKGLVALSKSGSGLKTILLVLLNLLVVPRIEKKPKLKYTFAFEELENNLHPALLRRLFQYLEDYAVKEKATVFLTTHSSTALDLFGTSKNAQIIHVTHNGEAARATTVSAHFDHLGVISELGAKPSDLLQANGIIWVEGPSDCIYINRWLDLFTQSRFQDGREYQCAFYGGSLLARTQFATPEEAEKELVNLFRVNPNIVVVCDGDRSSRHSGVKDRVRRIRAELQKIPGAHIWVTGAREIENYVPGAVLAKAVNRSSLPDPSQYEAFFPRKGALGSSYTESKMKRKGLDKMDLAVLSAPIMDREMMAVRFDWEMQMKKIVERIDSWNR